MKAKKLQAGCTIGITAPAGCTPREDVDKAVDILAQRGYKLRIGMSVYEQRGYLAGDDTLRGAELNAMFADKEIDAVLCLRGGYGTPRILDKINYEIIRQNPKIFIGYSDITALHIAIHQKAGLITFHGPMLTSDMLGGLDDYSRWTMEKALGYSEPIGDIINPREYPIKAYNTGSARGRLIGGNLSLICASLGTPYEIDTAGKILFIEEVGEEPYRIDRMLNQLRLAGKLRQAAGIILGDFNKCEPQDPQKSLALNDVIEDILIPCGKPILSGYKIGHCKPKITIPVGAEAYMDTHSKRFFILEAAVI